MRTLIIIGIICLLVTVPAGLVHADHPDDIYWSDQFAADNGVNGPVHAIVLYDNKLVVAGEFTEAGGRPIPYIAAWDGCSWSAVGTQNIHGPVYALHVFGGQLYAGGCFYIDDSSTVFGNENLAVLNGGTWQWVYGYANDTVFAISEFNGHLVIGGAFTSVGGNSAWKVAYLDGTRWARFENTLGGSVYAIATFRNELVVAGSTNYRYPPGGGMLQYLGAVARWDGTRFVSLNMGFSLNSPSRTPRVYDLLVCNDHLVACGYMEMAVGAVPGTIEFVNHIASWDGATWTRLGDGLDTTGYALLVSHDTLLVASSHTVRAWNGATWNTRGESASGGLIRELHESFYGLYMAGTFTSLGSREANRIARYSAAPGWLPVTTGVNGPVKDIAVFDNKVFAVGSFSRVDQLLANRVAAWNGAQWLNVGWLQTYPSCLAVFNGQLYSAGAFGDSYTYFMYPFELYNGSGSWTMTGPPIGPYPQSIGTPLLDAVEFQGRLVVAGFCPFTGPPFLSSWAGSGGWIPLGDPPNSALLALTVYDGQLIAAGVFTSIGGISANLIAAWDGARWTALGSGVDGAVYALTVYNGLLVAAGSFLNAGGLPAARIAAWDGQLWRPLGSGFDGTVRAVTQYGSQLIAGGQFASAGGTPVSKIAAWDGHSWLPLGSGVDSVVLALCAVDTSLYVGGQFTAAGSKSSPCFARWDRYPGTPTAIHDDLGNTLPRKSALYPNYPNPFNPTTTIAFDLPRRSFVTLSICNVLGQTVSTVLSRELSAGSHQVIWDGSDYASGVYFYRLQTDNYADTRKMIMIK